MHYRNGREAKNGDKVVLFGYGGPVVRRSLRCKCGKRLLQRQNRRDQTK